MCISLLTNLHIIPKENGPTKCGETQNSKSKDQSFTPTRSCKADGGGFIEGIDFLGEGCFQMENGGNKSRQSKVR